MKVYVEPRVEAGTDRGGEDLYLVFTAHHDGDTPPVDEPVECLLYVVDDWEGNTDVLDLTGDEPDEEFLPGVRVKYRTCHYDFEWEGTPEDALNCEQRAYEDGKVRKHTVLSVFQDPANWRFCHKPGDPPRLVCKVEHYVAGNAE